MRILLTLASFAFGLVLPARAASDVLCVDLRCEFMTDPVGVDRDQPRLSWRIESDSRGQEYIAHRILAASSAEKLAANEGDLWDSGRVDETVLLYRRYGGQHRKGEPLRFGQKVHWKVMVWDAHDEPSAWSEPARFTMALTTVQDWKAEWISFENPQPLPRAAEPLHLPAPRYYRKEFETGRKVKRALAFATALGIYELHLNGRKVGDAYFAPGWSDYRQRVYYNTYDVTEQLVVGRNCIGAVVADGWYAGHVGFGKLHGYGPNKSGRNIYGKTPALSVQLLLEYDDGSSETVLTDPSWQVGTGPEFEADLLMGESYDATKEIDGWSQPGFESTGWEQAIPAAENGPARAMFIDSLGRKSVDLSFSPPALMDAYPAPPVRITQELSAKAITEPAPGTWTFDFGQNFAGHVRLRVKGEAGQKITLRFGERLHPDGRLMTANLREARATDTYICKGDPQSETWSPRFTYHGFRYVEVTGLDDRPEPGLLTGLVLHNDLEFTSGFECSDPVVNAIYRNCLWTLRANLIDIPTNCSQRDERLGWSGDAQLAMSAGCYHLNARPFFGKWMRELQESRTEEGYFPSYAPYPFAHGRAVHGTAWSDAGLIAPFVLWRMYGERQVVQDRWFALEKYMKARLNADKDLDGSTFGEPWGDLYHLDDPTPDQFIDLCYLALDVRLVMNLAQITSGPIAYNTYKGVLVKIIENFNDQYVNEDGSLKVKSQTAHVLALRYGLLTTEQRVRVVEDLIALIDAAESETRSGLRTGLLGTRGLLTVLGQNGRGDEALRLLQSRKYPSWGFEAANGADTTWERWDAFTEEHGFKGVDGDYTAATNSFSHLAPTSVSEWIISSLAGIATQTPGFRQVLLQPTIPAATTAGREGPEPIRWVRAHYDSDRGRIAVHWKRNDDGSLLYEVTLPAHTTAILKLPAADGASILENGKPISEVEAVSPVDNPPADGNAWLMLGSGSYRFEVK